MSRIGALLIVAVVLAGCAHAPPERGPGDRAAWRSRHDQLLKITHWRLRARAGSTGIFGWSGSVDWRQRNSQFDITVSGPLGIGGMHISGTPALVLIRAHGETYTTTHPEQFLEQNLGVSLPVAGLRYWTLGVPVPDNPSDVRVDQLGRVVEMHQDGWTLKYTDYARTHGYYLPKKLTARREDVHLKMIVLDWQQVG